MVQKTVVHLTDDVDGGPAQHTLTFALDGVGYEIDLSEQNAGRFRQSLAPFVRAARRAGTPRRPVPVHVEVDSYDPQAVRAWARSRGIDLPPRGRIPQDVVEQFHAAGN
ncbi:iron-regulated LSR2 protein precursor [Beutenbergia cavernae DSM 12333]|uniref:Iron-regulated LSR2 protein n=1 Tax=Beutenbergia cavernae (strain ATCC BAA-8 / DSM 12333 / CCUG 43141 / JCM 11478 / NBRC 16432 / NCIMB 13614 / HKI 0122) TaxID=471853 RepID=C5C3Z0_BEUC1|nr:Lsr2 family protein [Beutenbergia cavernae]ACQ79903.1 iron-regulated LSR2 protein precursor [Beutenbergia cavernae DSM 12333]